MAKPIGNRTAQLDEPLNLEDAHQSQRRCIDPWEGVIASEVIVRTPGAGDGDR